MRNINTNINLRNIAYPMFLTRQTCELASELGKLYHESIDKYWELVFNLDKSKWDSIAVEINQNKAAIEDWLNIHPINEYWEPMYLYMGLIKALDSQELI